MILKRLIETIEHEKVSGTAAMEACRIGSIHYDSRGVVPGGLFVAVKGLMVDGHDFIEEAIDRGAAAIVAQKPLPAKVPYYRVKNTRRALASLSDTFFGHPSHGLTIIGITGTNGKTTTAYILENILKNSGCNVGVIGTVNYRYNKKVFDNPVTTPESLDLQRILAEMKTDGVSHVVMEISSHAIDLERIFKCEIDIGIFTNLSQDHLDYHHNMQSYWDCKKRLFTEHLGRATDAGSKTAVVNTGTRQGRELREELAYALITVGHEPENMIHPLSADFKLQGIAGRLQTPGGSFDFQSPLAGRYNLENILCAVGAGLALKLSLESIKKGIQGVSAVPGRLQRVPGPSDRHVYVDYAHTPDALENVLHALKALGPERLICIFGCGGNRDRAKRPLMGAISGRLSDLTIVTSDNPRTEKPGTIIDDILPGLKNTCSNQYRPGEIRNGWRAKGFLVEPDRKQAIRLGIEASKAGDIVVIAGKGHETYQIVGNRTLSFDDMREAEKMLMTHENQRRPEH
ncbi:MAG: UDP-N-acetylmuramoyl-L-alanyl-D-glutamate--2,6-diaminopimelate ligase [Deltaproteobacteria bacterium]|nr:UDP-N-acetylmuramoyl-L-alanyl-D-glutamate--2,6-diaminopimelate ligase [Deltaproteobacteria bacterium]